MRQTLLILLGMGFGFFVSGAIGQSSVWMGLLAVACGAGVVWIIRSKRLRGMP